MRVNKFICSECEIGGEELIYVGNETMGGSRNLFEAPRCRLKGQDEINKPWLMSKKGRNVLINSFGIFSFLIPSSLRALSDTPSLSNGPVCLSQLFAFARYTIRREHDRNNNRFPRISASIQGGALISIILEKLSSYNF